MLLAFVSCALLLQGSAPSQGKPKPLEKEINVYVSRNVAPGPNIRLNINTRNIPHVHVDAYSADPVAWLKQSPQDASLPKPKGKPVKRWDVLVAERNQLPYINEVNDFYFSRQVNLPVMTPGVYLLVISGGGKQEKAVVNVTNLAVVLKRSPSKMLTWVTDFKTGAVIPNATVTVYDLKGKQRASTKTGADGAVMLPLTPGDDTVVVNRGRDYAGIANSAQSTDGRLNAHFQTDRPIYRPGQRVFFKGILRTTKGQGYEPVLSKSLQVEFRDPKNNVIDRIPVTTSSFGTVSGAFDIPQEGMPGAYTLYLQTPFGEAYQTFTVAEYRKPEFQIKVAPAQKHYLAGQYLEFVVNSTYFFGAPVAQAKVSYQVRRSALPWYWDDDGADQWFYGGDGNLYASDTYDQDAFVANDVGYTDAQGNLHVVIKSDAGLPDSQYTFTCTVEDASRRQVSGSASVPVFAAEIRLGLRTRNIYTQVGDTIPVQVSAADLDGKPVGAKVDLSLVTYRWSEKKRANEQIILTKKTVVVPASGTTMASIPALVVGNLTLEARAKDKTGRVAKADMGLDIVGPELATESEKEAPSLTLTMDHKTYHPGDVPKAFVRSNNPSRPALLVVEGSDIWDYEVLPGLKGGYAYKVHTGIKMSPNAYVTATQWVRGRQVGANAILPLPDPSRALSLKVTPDKTTYRPGDKATYHIETRDFRGKPISAEVALGVVDEAIYSLSPDVTEDLYTTFWGLRPNNVGSFVSAPEEVSGGAYQRVSSVAPVRQRFEDTAFWNPIVQTNEQGVADISFEMPGNLTSWRATARGVTLSTSVGTTKSNVLANRPVMLRLATPRQVVAGDRFTLISTVDNRSDEAHEFEVKLDAEGIGLSGSTSQRVNVPAKSQEKLNWPLTATGSASGGNAVLTAQITPVGVSDPDLSDALRVNLRVVPKGIVEQQISGGTVKTSVEETIALPTDRVQGAGEMRIELRSGLTPAMSEAANSVLASYLYGSPAGANILESAVALHLGRDRKEVREALAFLSRTQQPAGWGWWESSRVSPYITARIAFALGLAGRNGITVYEGMAESAKQAAINSFNQTNLWEQKARLAAGILLLDPQEGAKQAKEVVDRGQEISPYAWLKLSEALAIVGNTELASRLASRTLKDLALGPAQTFMPAGEGIGWIASDVETTAQALSTSVRLGLLPEQQPKMAAWLANPRENWWKSSDEQAQTARALDVYLQRHPESGKLGEVSVEVNGQMVPVQKAKFTESGTALVPAALLKDKNEVKISRSEPGELLYSIQSSVYRPSFDETTRGVRVLRRFEVRNASGTWVELDRAVKPNEPVRVTIAVWGDDLMDAVKVTEPLPTGFEYVEDESSGYGRQEVRDGAVIHFVDNSGSPQVFRYYIRAEADGELFALPVTADYLRRPLVSGHSHAQGLTVKGG